MRSVRNLWLWAAGIVLFSCAWGTLTAVVLPMWWFIPPDVIGGAAFGYWWTGRCLS